MEPLHTTTTRFWLEHAVLLEHLETTAGRRGFNSRLLELADLGRRYEAGELAAPPPGSVGDGGAAWADGDIERVAAALGAWLQSHGLAVAADAAEGGDDFDSKILEGFLK